MQAIVLLADSAQADALNKVHALGLGWSVTSTPTPPATLVVFVKVPWTATNESHTFSLRLVDQDGQPVMAGQDRATGERAPLMAEGTFEVGRPPGLTPGMTIDQPIVLPLAPGMDLRPGQMYEWRLEIDGHHDEDWSAKFLIRRQ
jgi:hypothetical protein